MLAKQLILTGLRLMTLLAGLNLAATPLLAAGSLSYLADRNSIKSPYPATYSKSALEKAALTPPGPRRAEPFAKNRPVKPQFIVMVEEKAPGSKINPQLEKPARPAEPLPVVDSLASATNLSATRRTNVQVGYGKMLADNSNTVGGKNGTKLEEPGCLYVKTTIHF